MPKLYGIAEIAEALGAKRQTAAQWYRRGKLPPPDAVLRMGPVWLKASIEPWIRSRLASQLPSTKRDAPGGKRRTRRQDKEDH